MSRILVVEDDEIVRESICEVLHTKGHTTGEAVDGIAGLEMLDSGGFDLAIVDIWMPRMDGLGLLKDIRGQASNIPIIIISGGAPDASLEHATAMADSYGADAVLFKPFEDYELIEAVAEALNRPG